MIQTLKNMIQSIFDVSHLFDSLLLKNFRFNTDEYLYVTVKDDDLSVRSVCYKSLNYPIINCWGRNPS